VASALELTSDNETADTRCSMCRFGSYGLQSGRGCESCECNSNGSVTVQCSSAGVCPCKDTVVGRTCTDCRPGYFHFSADGCT